MRLAGPALVMVTGLVVSGCYRDALTPTQDLAPATVLLTDSPFPFGLADRVEVYVSQVAASITPDTLPAAQRWVIIAEPRLRLDLLTLQQGAATVIGTGDLPEGTYAAVRLTLNGDSSAIVMSDGRKARVQWPTTGEVTVSAILEQPLVVSGAGTRIAIDFDVGRSFAYNVNPLFDFVFLPFLRAVDADRTGWLSGTVRGDSGSGIAQPLADAVITLYRGDGQNAAATWWVVATGHTDGDGRFTVAYLTPGAYIAQVEVPWSRQLSALTVSDILIGAGAGSRLDVTLPAGPGLHRALQDPLSVVRRRGRSRS